MSKEYKFGALSLSRLNGVHPDLVRVMKRAISISDLDFAVVEGLRTLERQKVLLAKGASKTLKSRHITGHAVDIAPFIGGTIRWDWPLFNRLGATVKEAAELEDVSIVWGGDWKSFKDGPHFELDRKVYPAPKGQ